MRFLFRITHWQNIEQYLRDGVIRAKNIGPQQAGYRVSDAGIVSRRGVDISATVGFPINDYVPFYFSPLTAMSMSIAYGRVKVVDPHNREVGDSSSSDMALVVARVDQVATHGDYKFTDAACNTSIPPNIYDDVNLLENVVKWSLFDDGDIKGAIPEIGYSGVTKYCSDYDRYPQYHNRKKERMAEFMVHREFPLSLCCAIITPISMTQKNIENLVNKSSFNIPVLTNPGCFY